MQISVKRVVSFSASYDSCLNSMNLQNQQIEQNCLHYSDYTKQKDLSRHLEFKTWTGVAIPSKHVWYQILQIIHNGDHLPSVLKVFPTLHLPQLTSSSFSLLSIPNIHQKES